MNFHSTSSNQISIQNIVTDELISQDIVPDVKYQDIIYYMDNAGKIVKNEDQIHIDFITATSEMKNLDWTYEYNYIGFENLRRTNDCVQFIRQGQDRWYAEVPIRHGKGWDGYAWCGYSDSETALSLMRLFFEEIPWFGMLSWKMRRFRHD